MEASTCPTMTLILSCFSHSHWENVSFAFDFPEFASLQTASSKIKLAVLFSTIENLGFFGAF